MVPFKRPYRQFNKYQPQRQVSRYKVNEAIYAPKLMVIDSNGEQLGILDKFEALRIAKEQELDLIEVAPNADPPVAKILSWSKFKYQQEKKKKENKGKTIEMKEMWFKAFIGDGDFEHKIERIKEFLSKKHPVKITIRGKGRVQSTHLWALLERIKIALLDSIQESNETAKQEGRNIFWIVRPIKNIKINENEDKNT